MGLRRTCEKPIQLRAGGYTGRMKIRESGMPDEAYWESLFDVPLIVSRLGVSECHDVAELGCGYGTFQFP
jgi:hypothetical protein